MTGNLAQNYRKLRTALDACAAQSGHPVALLAVSKTHPAARIAECAALGQRAFGENYVQEALGKIAELAALGLEWHLIGPLQSNKCQAAAEHFDWVQTVDRAKIIPLLARHRPAGRPPLNVLIQVNVDGEASKSGCAPDQAAELAALVAAEPRLALRGLMAIPDPATSGNGLAFAQMQRLFRELRGAYPSMDTPSMDTLSMGMSDDFPIAIAHGANLVRVGSALFGRRGP